MNRATASLSPACSVLVLQSIGSIQLEALHALIIVETHWFSGRAKNGSESADFRVGTWPPTVPHNLTPSGPAMNSANLAASANRGDLAQAATHHPDTGIAPGLSPDQDGQLMM